MKTSSARVGVQHLALILVWLIFWLGIPVPSLADGGEFPTSTPTVTITPSPTITPTGTTTIAPTPTATVTPFPLQPDLQEQPIEPTPVPPARPSAGILCWPFAVVLILIVVILSTWLFRRRTQM
jgi:hypothetical protein